MNRPPSVCLLYQEELVSPVSCSPQPLGLGTVHWAAGWPLLPFPSLGGNANVTWSPALALSSGMGHVKPQL